MQQIETLSFFIKERMKFLNITQQQLADMTGLSVLTIGAIIRAKEGTAIKNWIIVADALGANMNLTTKKMSNEARKSI